MKNISLSVLVVAVAVGGLVGAVTSYVIGPADDVSRPPAQSRVVADTGATAKIEESLRALQKDSREMLDRIAALEQRPLPTNSFSAKSAVTKEDLAALTEQVEEWIAERAAPPALPDQVAETLREIRKEETATRTRKKADARRAGREKRLERISQELNLSTQQAEDLRLEFEARALRNAEVKRVWAETPELIGPVKTAAHQAHQTALGRIFTPQQLETYQASELGGGKD
jgi:hypothetical protein